MSATTFLIVEDSPTMRQLLAFSLRRLKDCRIIEAVDGVDALKKLTTERVDLVITDINMPEMDGITLLREIRKHPALGRTPVLILTTSTDDEVKASARAAGATGWIGKPFHPDQLSQIVARVLGRERPG